MAARQIVHVKDVFSGAPTPPPAPSNTNTATSDDVVGNKSSRLVHGKKRRAPAPPTAAVCDQRNRCDDVQQWPQQQQQQQQQQSSKTDMLLRTTELDDVDHKPTKLTDYFTCGNANCLCTVLSGEQHYCDTATLRARAPCARNEGDYDDDDDGCCALANTDDGNLTAVSNASQSGSSSGYQSELGHVMNGTETAVNHRQARDDEGEEEDESFAEEECAIDLEEEDAESRYTTLYKEYHGEDFSKYLLDDSDAFAPPPGLSKWITNSSNVQKRITGADRTMKNTIKHRLSKMFTISRSHRNANTRVNEHSIYDFTYRDTKIAKDEVCNEFPYEGESTDNSIGNGRHWWSVTTLSAKSIGSNDDSSFLSRTQSAFSGYDVTNSDRGSALVSGNPNGNVSAYESDVETTRRSTRDNGMGAKQNIKKKATVWKRFRDSLRRLERSKYSARSDDDDDDDDDYDDYDSEEEKDHCTSNSLSGTEMTSYSHNTHL